MSKQPKREEPEIKPPAPDVKQQPLQPEIPPDKDTPQKEDPIKAGDIWHRIATDQRLTPM
jgi:hypothetical protein